MKKKIIIVLSVFSLLSLLGGVYLIRAIDGNTSRFDNLIMLHQAEILREHLLLNIRSVQADLYLHYSRRAPKTEKFVDHVRTMGNAISVCTECHHEEPVAKRIEDLDQQIRRYNHTLSRVLTVRGGSAQRHKAEEVNAYALGEELINQVNTMIVLTNRKLNEKTSFALREARRTRTALIAIIAVGPLLALGLAVALISGFTKPINVLLNATKRLKAGDLDYRIEGLKDEFGELAVAFNDMGGALREHMREIGESERRYRLLFESAGDAIFILDAEGEQAGRIVQANQAAARMHGYTVDELLTFRIQDIDTPDSAAKSPEKFERLLKGEWIKAVIEHYKKDGTVFPLEMSAGVFEFGGRKYVLAIDRDITERKQAEEALQRAEQIRTAGELATGLAHEIKNPLAGIKVTMEALSEEPTLSKEDRGVLAKVIDEIKRIEGLIKGLLDFARPPKPQFTSTDVNSVLDSAAQLVLKNVSPAPGKPRKIELEKDFGLDLPEITADPMQLKQVFMNLLLNAVDAMPEGGRLVLKTAYDQTARAIKIALSDTGKGIDAAALDKIFQPFFTTKSKGTGLGLAISKRLIEDHGGKIGIESVKGAGSTFRINLPCDEGRGRKQP
jgi:two-component system sensor histidine kinase AtoS